MSNGFSKKLKAPLHGLDRQGNVGVTGHQDDGSVVVVGGQFALEFQSVHSGHADVGHDAARLRPRPGVQERHRRLVDLHGKARRCEQECQRLEDIGIIVDDVNDLAARQKSLLSGRGLGRAYGSRRGSPSSFAHAFVGNGRSARGPCGRAVSRQRQ